MSLSRRNLNLRDKIEIIKFYEENKLSLQKIAAKFQIGRTHVSTILENKNKLLRTYVNSTCINFKIEQKKF